MPNFFAETDLANTAAIRGTHQGDGSSGVFGEAKTGPGVSGSSATSVGVDAKSANGPAALRAVHAGDGPGVLGASKFNGVLGRSSGETGFAGVRGEATGGPGVSGESANSVGVDAKSQAGPAALRAVHAGGGPGVLGIGGKLGIIGESAAGDGVVGRGRRGVVGESPTFQGVFGKSGDNAGVVGESQSFHAVFGISRSANHGGIFGANTAGGFAGVFDGRVAVNGDITVSGDVVLAGADVAEQFDVSSRGVKVLPGSVVVLDDDGSLTTSDTPYDSRVAGIVSGAGDRAPALILDRPAVDAAAGSALRSPVAVIGKAWCLADATSEPINVGDLLTTSGSEGHAMRASDRLAAFGAVIGKALSPLNAGTGLVLVLVGLG